MCLLLLFVYQNKQDKDQFSDDTIAGVGRDVWEVRFGEGLSKKGEVLFTYEHKSFPIVIGTMFLLLLVCIFANKCIMKAPTSTMRPLLLLSSRPKPTEAVDEIKDQNKDIDDINGIDNNGCIKDN